MIEGYYVPGWPVSVAGHSAVTPNLTRMAGSGAMQYKDGVTGRPGTEPIGVGAPAWRQDVTGMAMMGTSRSQDAPASIRPNQYWARPQRDFWPGAGMPVSVRSDNLMPVPATDPRGIPARLAAPVVQRGGRQIQALPSLVMWPPVNG